MPTEEWTEEELREMDELGISPDDFKPFSFEDGLDMKPDDPLFCENPMYKKPYGVMFREAKERGEELYVIYRMEVVGTDKFYVGVTRQDLRKYWGSGERWRRYLKKHGVGHDRIRKRVIRIVDERWVEHVEGVSLEDLAFMLEESYIQEFFGNAIIICDDGSVDVDLEAMQVLNKYKNRCLNLKYGLQNGTICAACPECGGKQGKHKKRCSKYKKPKPCPECGSSNISSHRKTCSKYKRNTTSTACPECGEYCGKHKRTCSSYIAIQPCSECGGLNGSHYKVCSQYKTTKCFECGGKAGKHKKQCSRYKPNKRHPCPECGNVGFHKKRCSKYIEVVCPECGGKQGRHYKICSKYVAIKPIICPECGGRYSHKKSCSKFKQPQCTECGGKRGFHKRSCSQCETGCSECGGIYGHHKYSCSKSSRLLGKVCQECGGKAGHHKKSCSKFKQFEPCSECGGKRGKHKKQCSKFRPIDICFECGGKSNAHYKTCSQYKRNTVKCPACCAEAGTYHKPTCTFHGTRFVKADLSRIQRYLQDHHL